MYLITSFDYHLITCDISEVVLPLGTLRLARQLNLPLLTRDEILGALGDQWQVTDCREASGLIPVPCGMCNGECWGLYDNYRDNTTFPTLYG